MGLVLHMHRGGDGGGSLVRTLVRSVLALSALVSTAAGGYMLIEGWGLLDAVWMAVITLTTIGFGEVKPLSDLGRVFTLAYIVVGVGVTTRLIAIIAQDLADGELLREYRARRARKEISRMTDHYIVIGYGRLGREIVADLRYHGAPVVVIDKEPVEDLPEGVHLIHGDATLDETLEAANIQHARGMAVATPSDAINVFVCLSARQLHEGLDVHVRIEDEAAAHKARRAGATGVLLPYHLSGARMAQGLLRPGASAFIQHATSRAYDDLLMEDVQITEHAAAQGTLAQLELRARFGVMVVAIQRPGMEKLLHPTPDTCIEVGDTLVVVGAPDDVHRFVEEEC